MPELMIGVCIGLLLYYAYSNFVKKSTATFSEFKITSNPSNNPLQKSRKENTTTITFQRTQDSEQFELTIKPGELVTIDLLPEKPKVKRIKLQVFGSAAEAMDHILSDQET